MARGSQRNLLGKLAKVGKDIWCYGFAITYFTKFLQVFHVADMFLDMEFAGFRFLQRSFINIDER